jgi:hypothetical protein
MNILRKSNSFDLLALALSEQDERKRYSLLNTVAEAYAQGETDIERNFAAVCYELNGEPHAADNYVTGYAVEEDNSAMYFARACIMLWRALYYVVESRDDSLDMAKKVLEKTISTLREEKNYKEMGMLLKIQKMLLEKAAKSPKNFYQFINLPFIVVLKIFTPSIPHSYSEEALKCCMDMSEKLKKDVAVVITSCTNILEQKMLNTFLEHGLKPICAPLMPVQKLQDAYLNNKDGDQIVSTMRECELLEPITDYSPELKDVWPLVEEYGAKQLLGLGLLKNEENELPIRYVWADFSNSHIFKEIEDICLKKDIEVMRIGGQNA